MIETEFFFRTKKIFTTQKNKVILNWMQQFYDKFSERLAYMVRGASDFQNNKIVFITNTPSKSVVNHSQTHDITANNLIQNAIFIAVRHCIPADWLNDRDQFLYPNNGWENDTEFQNDCLAFTLFHGENRISAKESTNHWLPFTEQEVDAKEKFSSHFMTDFISGKLGKNLENNAEKEENNSLFESEKIKSFIPEKNMKFSPQAKAVFEAGRDLWKYYFEMNGENSNPSLYNIKEFFQGRNENGRINNKSEDEKYNEKIEKLRQSLKVLAKKIEPKIYEYGFLKA